MLQFLHRFGLVRLNQSNLIDCTVEKVVDQIAGEYSLPCFLFGQWFIKIRLPSIVVSQIKVDYDKMIVDIGKMRLLSKSKARCSMMTRVVARRLWSH